MQLLSRTVDHLLQSQSQTNIMSVPYLFSVTSRCGEITTKGKQRSLCRGCRIKLQQINQWCCNPTQLHDNDGPSAPRLRLSASPLCSTKATNKQNQRITSGYHHQQQGSFRESISRHVSNTLKTLLFVCLFVYCCVVFVPSVSATILESKKGNLFKTRTAKTRFSSGLNHLIFGSLTRSSTSVECCDIQILKQRLCIQNLSMFRSILAVRKHIRQLKETESQSDSPG